MFSAVSWAEWTKVWPAKGIGDVYIDLDNIKKDSGFAYYWYILDYFEPSDNGTFSMKAYNKIDCKTLGDLLLTMTMYKQPMARGTASGPFPVREAKWSYPAPDSVKEATRQTICNQ